MKYIAIVSLCIIGNLNNSVNGLRIVTDKLAGEESASAEADIDALMDKYDEKEKSDKESKDSKGKVIARPVDPNQPTKEMVQD